MSLSCDLDRNVESCTQLALNKFNLCFPRQQITFTGFRQITVHVYKLSFSSQPKSQRYARILHVRFDYTTIHKSAANRTILIMFMGSL